MTCLLFLSSDLAPGELVNMKGPACYTIGEGNCMLKCIYGLVQAPNEYYMLCSEVYQKDGLKQLKYNHFSCYKQQNVVKGKL